jgi:UDP-galactopyranose mutase
MTLTSRAARTAPLLLCFSQLRWGFVFQRPQHLMNRAARTHRVLYWEEPMLRGGENPRLDRFPQANGLEVITPVLPEGMGAEQAGAALRRLLDARLAESEAEAPDVAWYITPQALSFSAHLRPRLTIYDNMDELSAFKNAPRELLMLEDKLLRRADVVFTGGQSIYEAKARRHANIHPVPSSIEREHFAKARNWSGPEPEDQAAIPHPRVGWFGVIDERTDLDLIEALAALRPGWQFVMLGPVVKIGPESLPKRANIHWLGAKSYGDLPAYLAGWDAGFIPFALNEATRFISPTKTPEYLAAGLRVAATPIRDIVRPYGDLGLVEIAATPGEMSAALRRAMAGGREAWLAKVDRFLSGKSWDRTWEEMHGLMRQAARKRSAPALAKEAAYV